MMMSDECPAMTDEATDQAMMMIMMIYAPIGGDCTNRYIYYKLLRLFERKKGFA